MGDHRAQIGAEFWSRNIQWVAGGCKEKLRSHRGVSRTGRKCLSCATSARAMVRSVLSNIFHWWSQQENACASLDQFAGTLSGGEQQMLAIGRALMANPRVLLLDEPSMGLAPQIVADIFRIIREINRDGTTVLLVEQNARKALSIADYCYVLESGRIQVEGAPADIIKSPKILDAYLGGMGVRDQ